MNKKVIVVAGATATGKTALAEKIALEQNGELISADSRQNYEHLDIGTNKGFLINQHEIDAAKLPVYLTQTAVRVHQVSFLDLNQTYSAADFQSNTAMIIKEILEAGKTPIIVGGTGLYIQSVLEAKRYNFTDSQDNGEFKDLNLGELQKLITQQHPDTWQRLGYDRKQNAVHLRGLLRQLKRQGNQREESNHVVDFLTDLDFKLIYTQQEQEKHKKILESRVREMWKAGLVNEVKKIFELGFTDQTPALKTIGYPEVIQFINGELTEAEAQTQIWHAHWQYARKQVKWFKKYFQPLLRDAAFESAPQL